ncbi:unnamed protein product [Gordionus sp. m RMFG-2023]
MKLLCLALLVILAYSVYSETTRHWKQKELKSCKDGCSVTECCAKSPMANYTTSPSYCFAKQKENQFCSLPGNQLAYVSCGCQDHLKYTRQIDAALNCRCAEFSAPN